MKWVDDRTQRFGRRPHYEPRELDELCEGIVEKFLCQRHGNIAFPIGTDDLTVLIEQFAVNLDLYADLTEEGLDVEGVTNFISGQRPRVRISRGLSLRPGLENRLRTTLTHEFAHVHFHNA